MIDIKENVRRIEERVDVCAKKSGKTLSDIAIVAVSKTVNADAVEQAKKAGFSNFGENRVQEFLKKREVIGDSVNWHIIGPLQRNKVKYILNSVYLLHSLDRLSLAHELEKQCLSKGTQISALVQVNIAKRANQIGVSPDELEPLLEAVSVMRSVRIKGLMAIPPIAYDADDNRPYFAKMKALFDKYKQYDPKNTFEFLSMGMSGDFEAAIEEGSNMVRIGTAVFGARSK